jgi:mannose-6-phosphate isomerase-like protein (cupin superfamily)
MTETTISSPYRLASGEGIDNVWWKDGRVTVKAGRAETGGAFAQIETDDPRGSGPPLHLHHNEDETFFVLEGEVTMVVGGEQLDLSTGDYCFASRGVAHAYVVRSERARMLVTVTPPGPEELFVELGVPVTGDEPPTDTVMPPVEEMARQFARYSCEILGPPISLSDLS